MASRLAGFTSTERRRDRRRAVVIESTLDDEEIHILDIGLSGFGASGAITYKNQSTWPEIDQRAELKFTDYRNRKVFVLVTITYVDSESGRFGGTFMELAGNAYDVIEGLMLNRDWRAAKA